MAPRTTPARPTYRRLRSTPKMLRWISRPAGVFMNRRAILPTWIRSWVSTPPWGAGARRGRLPPGAEGAWGGVGGGHAGLGWLQGGPGDRGGDAGGGEDGHHRLTDPQGGEGRGQVVDLG